MTFKNLISNLKNEKTIKAVSKPIPKKIIDCIGNSSLTASEIASKISFPKEKIYYHIKKLVSLNILFVSEKDEIKGIVQKKYKLSIDKISDEGNQNIIKENLDNENGLDDCDNPLVRGDFGNIDPFGFSQIAGLQDVKRHAVGYNEYSDLRNVEDANRLFTRFFSTAHVECWRTDMDIVKVHSRYFRPSEVDSLLGDATKAREVLGWKPEISFEELVKDMCTHEV